MKNFKIALCALLVLCSGLFFAACGGEKTKTFDASKISTVDETAVYDGNSHVFTVKYDSVKNVNVTYSETKNGSFVSKDKLGLVDAGEYEVYYKLSAKGYESYISANPLTFTINKRPYSFEFGEGSTFQFNVNDNFDINEVVCYTHNVVGNDDVVPQFKIYKHDEPNTLFPTNPAEIANLAGQTYDIALTGIEGSDADNYSFVSESERTATLKLINNIMVKNGETETYYKTLADAISNATQQGDIVQLTRDVEIDKVVDVNSNVSINGFGHKITLSNNFVPGIGDDQNGRFIFDVKNATLTLENVVVDGAQKVTCVTVVDGKIVLENGAKIINGKRTVEGKTSAREIDKLVGGLYLTGKSELTMNGGEISGNSNAVEGEYEREVRKYASDLWIGSEAKATISGGLIGNMFINANSSQAADSLTKVNGAAHIENAFIELDGGKHANLDLESDNLIDNIIVKVGTNQEGEDKVRTYSNEQVVTGKYKGGFGLVSIKSGDTEFATLQDAVDSVANQGIIEIFHNIEIDSQVNLPSNKEFTITSADNARYEIGVTADFEGTAMLSADGNTNNLKLTLKNIVIDGRLKTSCLYLTNTELTVTNDAVVCNGKLMAEDDANTEKLLNGGVYMTGKSTFTMDGGLIKDNHNADKDGVEFGSKQEDEIYLFAKDLWLGSEVKANITGGEIGSIWVNANKSSSDEPDEEGYGLTVSGTAKIENVYLDYYNDDNGEAYGTTLQYGCEMEGGYIADCTALIETIYIRNYFAKDDEANYEKSGCTIIDNTTTNVYNFYESGFVGTMVLPEVDGLSNYPIMMYLNYNRFTEILERGLGSAANYEINLLVDIKLSSTQFIKQNVTINGYEHTISAIKNVENFGATTEGTYQGKENRSLFMIPCGDEYANLEVKFNNVTLDGNGLARGLSLYKGKTTLENVIIKNGKAADNSWSGGIFLTGDAELSINECTITGNVQYDEEIESGKIEANEYINYAADLWVGANAKVVVESSAVDNNTIGNVWVNANEYSQNNQGSFTLTNGEIENVWLEYDKGYGAILNVNSGVVKNLYISQGYTENEYNKPVVVANAEAGKYVGGANAYVTKNDTKVYGYFEELVTDTDIDEVRLVADVEVKKVIKIENERSLTIDGENGDEKFTIKASTEFAKEDNLNGTSLSTIFYVKQATLTIRDAILNGNSVARAISSFAGGETNAYIYLENVEVVGGKDVDGRHSGGVFLSDKTIATLTNCTINENVGAEAVKDERLNYAADLWIGSEVKATIYKGSYGKIFVNANKYTIDDEVNLTIDENASINTMWVEYDIKGATVNLISGSIGLLYVASTENRLPYNEYNFTVRAGEESKTLRGGVPLM